MKQFVCIDIGGTSIKHGIIDESGTFLYTNELPTQAQLGGASIMEKAMGIVSDACRQYALAGICISTAGMVDCEAGAITHAAELIPGYAGTPIKKPMEDHFSIPCEVENDVNCAGLAEYYAGAAKGCSSSLCLTVGTGIGGSAILNGQVLHGFSGSGCEVGYMHLPGGCFQDLAASSVLVKRTAYRKKVSPDSIDGRYIFEQAKNGDPDCIAAIDEMADILGMGIANLCYVLNPEIVVLGGGIMAQKDYLYSPIRLAMDRYLVPFVAEKTRLSFAENQNQAGMLGAWFHFKSRHKEICHE